MKWLKLAALNALRNRRRSLVTIAIAALGTAAILLGGGFALFTYESLAEASARDTGHLIVAHPGFFADEEKAPLELGVPHPQELVRQLLREPAVRTVLPRLQFSGLVSNGDRSEIFVGSGVDAEREFTVKGPFLRRVAGELLDSAAPRPQVVLGDALAKRLGAMPGQSLTLLATTTGGALNALDVDVAGVVSSGIPDVDKRLLLTALPTAQQLLATDRVSSLGVYLQEMDQVADTRNRLQPALAAAGLATRSWREEAVFYEGVRNLYNRIFGFIGAILGVIVAFAIANTLAMSVIERTREIGALRAMGTLPAQITRLFALEGATLAGVGVALGAAVSGALSLALLHAEIQMPPPPGRSTGYPLVVSVDPGLYAATAIGLVLLSLAVAWLVSRRTAHQPIVEALTHV